MEAVAYGPAMQSHSFKYSDIFGVSWRRCRYGSITMEYHHHVFKIITKLILKNKCPHISMKVRGAHLFSVSFTANHQSYMKNGLYWLAGNALGTNVRLLISEKCEMSMFFSGLFAILTMIGPKTTRSFFKKKTHHTSRYIFRLATFFQILNICLNTLLTRFRHAPNNFIFTQKYEAVNQSFVQCYYKCNLC